MKIKGMKDRTGEKEGEDLKENEKKGKGRKKHERE